MTEGITEENVRGRVIIAKQVAYAMVTTSEDTHQDMMNALFTYALISAVSHKGTLTLGERIEAAQRVLESTMRSCEEIGRRLRPKFHGNPDA